MLAAASQVYERDIDAMAISHRATIERYRRKLQAYKTGFNISLQMVELSISYMSRIRENSKDDDQIAIDQLKTIDAIDTLMATSKELIEESKCAMIGHDSQKMASLADRLADMKVVMNDIQGNSSKIAKSEDRCICRLSTAAQVNQTHHDSDEIQQVENSNSKLNGNSTAKKNRHNSQLAQDVNEDGVSVASGGKCNLGSNFKSSRKTGNLEQDSLEDKEWKNCIRHVANIVSHMMKTSSILANFVVAVTKTTSMPKDAKLAIRQSTAKFTEAIFERHRLMVKLVGRHQSAEDKSMSCLLKFADKVSEQSKAEIGSQEAYLSLMLDTLSVV